MFYVRSQLHILPPQPHPHKNSLPPTPQEERLFQITQWWWYGCNLPLLSSSFPFDLFFPFLVFRFLDNIAASLLVKYTEGWNGFLQENSQSAFLRGKLQPSFLFLPLHTHNLCIAKSSHICASFCDAWSDQLPVNVSREKCNSILHSILGFRLLIGLFSVGLLLIQCCYRFSPFSWKRFQYFPPGWCRIKFPGSGGVGLTLASSRNYTVFATLISLSF